MSRNLRVKQKAKKRKEQTLYRRGGNPNVTWSDVCVARGFLLDFFNGIISSASVSQQNLDLAPSPRRSGNTCRLGTFIRMVNERFNRSISTSLAPCPRTCSVIFHCHVTIAIMHWLTPFIGAHFSPLFPLNNQESFFPLLISTHLKHTFGAPPNRPTTTGVE